MKQVSTILKTGDMLTIPDSKLIGKVGTYKDGKIKVMWQIDNCSGISENLPTREWNRRIKEGKIIIS